MGGSRLKNATSPDAVILRSYSQKSFCLDYTCVIESFLFMWGIVGTEFIQNFRALFRWAPATGCAGLWERWLRLRELNTVVCSYDKFGFRLNEK